MEIEITIICDEATHPAACSAHQQRLQAWPWGELTAKRRKRGHRIAGVPRAVSTHCGSAFTPLYVAQVFGCRPTAYRWKAQEFRGWVPREARSAPARHAILNFPGCGSWPRPEIEGAPIVEARSYPRHASSRAWPCIRMRASAKGPAFRRTTSWQAQACKPQVTRGATEEKGDRSPPWVKAGIAVAGDSQPVIPFATQAPAGEEPPCLQPLGDGRNRAHLCIRRRARGRGARPETGDARTRTLPARRSRPPVPSVESDPSPTPRPVPKTALLICLYRVRCLVVGTCRYPLSGRTWILSL